MDKEKVIQMFKNGMLRKEIAEYFHVQTFAIQQILKGYPTARKIERMKQYPNFKEWFCDLYNSTNDINHIKEECLKHPFFSRIRKTSIHQRICELRKLFDLEPKMPERTYDSEYERIKGYIIRNTKFMAKRRGIYFNIKPKDFELPEKCPILECKLEYGAGTDGNGPRHATLDRIDNSKGYIPGNVMVVSRLANAMKNSASFKQLSLFIKNYKLLIDNIDKDGIRGSITDIFPHWKKLSLDS